MNSSQKIQLNSFNTIPAIDSGYQYPLEYMKTHGCIVLEMPSDPGAGVTVGLTKENRELERDLRDYHRGDVRFVLIDHAEFSAYLSRMASVSVEGASAIHSKHRHSVDRLANDAPNINLVNSIIIDAIRKKASDIHLESFEEQAPVRYRIDGVLHDAGSIEISRFPGVSSRLKIMAGLNIMERRLPQDGRISIDIEGETVDLRISTVPVSRGESIVLRIFNKQKEALTIESLGFPDYGIEAVQRISKMSNGLFLVTGPTGSGKSTTLYALLRRLNLPDRKLVSIEDPIEQEIEGVNQIQVNEAIDLSFGTLLRRILRQDPDIIMVGEIRDSETAELAVRAAMTGHLVLATLHTNDSVSAIHRICNMGIPPYLLGAVLRGVMAQRLVRKLCQNCRKKAEVTGSSKAFAAKNKWSIKHAYSPEGCDTCGDTGYAGRTAIMEVFTGSYELEDMIAGEEPTMAIRAFLRESGMQPLLRDGYEKVKKGITSIPEIERAAAI